MPYCAVLVCKNDSRYKNITHGGISYHRFPKDPFQKEKWIDATGRQNWMPTKTSTICSEHFIENDISITPKGLRCLNTMAVPTQKIVTVINLTDEGTSMSSNLLKKREADFSAAGDEIGPCKKKTCRTSIDPSQGIVQDLKSKKHLKSLDGGNIRKEALTVQILRQFVGSSIFDDISDHQLGEFPASNHVTDLIKAVIMRYLNVRIHHLLKLRMKISKRQLLNKYVLFQGQ